VRCAFSPTTGSVSGTARALGMEWTNLHTRVRALGLSLGKWGLIL